MNNIKLQPGDIFCGSNPQSLGLVINYVQKFGSIDSSAIYSHAGIIIDNIGTTFEALWTIDRRNIFQAYLGERILIGRHKLMTEERFQKGGEFIRQYSGYKYPAHRLAFFLFPPLAKYVHFVDWGVCSEFTSLFLNKCDLIDFGRGVFPDYLAGVIKHGKNWDIVYEGEI